jgi:molybdenum cofactor cytidylyltransferase
VIAAVIVAAGRGRRLGGLAKALLRAPCGESYLGMIAGLARGAGVGELLVVTGGVHRAVTEAEAARLGLAIAANPYPARGMASSVALGFSFAAAAFGARSALLWPVDHPRVSRATLAALVREAHEDRAVIPVFRGRGGHPAAMGRGLWGPLSRCGDAPEGARTVLRARPRHVVRLDVDDPGVIADVDTPADLGARARRARG